MCSIGNKSKVFFWKDIWYRRESLTIALPSFLFTLTIDKDGLVEGSLVSLDLSMEVQNFLLVI